MAAVQRRESKCAATLCNSLAPMPASSASGAAATPTKRQGNSTSNSSGRRSHSAVLIGSVSAASVKAHARKKSSGARDPARRTTVRSNPATTSARMLGPRLNGIYGLTAARSGGLLGASSSPGEIKKRWKSKKPSVSFSMCTKRCSPSAGSQKSALKPSASPSASAMRSARAAKRRRSWNSTNNMYAPINGVLISAVMLCDSTSAAYASTNAKNLWGCGARVEAKPPPLPHTPLSPTAHRQKGTSASASNCG